MKIGNLSCSVITVPDFFLLSKQPTDNVLQVPCPYQKYNVFREKDFFRFSPLANLNFNRNRKLQLGESNYIYKAPTFEQLMGIEIEQNESESNKTQTDNSLKKLLKQNQIKNYIQLQKIFY